jgi:hypothetical protein
MLILIKKKDSTNSYLQDATLYEYDSLKVKKIYKVYQKMPYSSFNIAYNNGGGFYKGSHYNLYKEVLDFDSLQQLKKGLVKQ